MNTTVALLAEVNLDPTVPPDQWFRWDGTPLTPDEVFTVLAATREDLLAVDALLDARLTAARAQHDQAGAALRDARKSPSR